MTHESPSLLKLLLIKPIFMNHTAFVVLRPKTSTYMWNFYRVLPSSRHARYSASLHRHASILCIGHVSILAANYINLLSNDPSARRSARQPVGYPISRLSSPTATRSIINILYFLKYSKSCLVWYIAARASPNSLICSFSSNHWIDLTLSCLTLVSFGQKSKKWVSSSNTVSQHILQ